MKVPKIYHTETTIANVENSDTKPLNPSGHVAIRRIFQISSSFGLSNRSKVFLSRAFQWNGSIDEFCCSLPLCYFPVPHPVIHNGAAEISNTLFVSFLSTDYGACILIHSTKPMLFRCNY